MKLKELFLFIFLLFTLVFKVQAAPVLTLQVTGEWTLQIDSTDLTGLAGSDFPGSFESSVTEVDLGITQTLGDSSPWTLYVGKSDTNWAGNVLVYCRRTSDGTGAGTISGGTNFQLLTNSNEIFFTGTGDRTAVKIQFRLVFLIKDVNVDVYTTKVNYTIIE